MAYLIPISDARAAEPSVSGGKGSNSHRLFVLAQKTDAFQVSSTLVLTTELFDQLVLPQVKDKVLQLDSLSDPERDNKQLEDICGDIRENILALKLPDCLIKRLGEEFKKLGSDVAVRSSATCEDGEQYSAAGQGYTALHQTTLEAVQESIKEVWASLYSPGFTLYLKDLRIRLDGVRMAILLQKFVNPCAAGVVHSFDQGTGRPGYCISAQPGIGEGVVQPAGAVDHWFVGPFCGEHDILESTISKKERRVVTRHGGGTKLEPISIQDASDASLGDDMILRIARAARCVKRDYTTQNPAGHIDIEFAVQGKNLFLLQARPKPFQGVKCGVLGGPVVSTTTVDLSTVASRRIKVIKLSRTSVTAVEGAVTAKLAVSHGAKSCPPGSIVVEHHTNNEFNAKFASLAGVITADGDQTSHASQHAYEKQIPCVVGASGVVDLLRPHDGRVVTFDAGTQIVYLGEVPIEKKLQCLDLWLTNPPPSPCDEGTRHEIFRSWSDSKAKRPEVFREDLEGHFRLRSNTYRYFQLDYYYKGWDRLTEKLTSMFGCRTGRELKTQARQIKAVDSGQCLVHEVKQDDPESIYHYLMSVQGFCTADLTRLFEARLEGFRRFAAFVHTLHRIDKSNVEKVVEELVDIFAWMHIGFWLDMVVESFAQRQLQYIGDKGSLHNVLRDEAILELESEFWVDPESSWIPKGQILNLSRQRDKDVYELIELIRSDPRLVEIFSCERLTDVELALKTEFPSVLDLIKGWSMKFKLTCENLDLPQDTEEYIIMLKRILDEDSSMSEAMLSVVYREYLREHNELDQKTPPAPECLRTHDEQLYQLCRAHARTIIAEPGVSLSEVTRDCLDARFREILTALHERALVDMRFGRDAAAQVLHSNYPELKEILRISKLQVVLREDGHHLIVPRQRKIAKMMLDAAKDFCPNPLGDAEEVFDLSTDEFVALFLEDDPGVIAQGMPVRGDLLKAEQHFEKCWSVTLQDFENIPLDNQRLWQQLSREKVGLINEFGALQDKCWTQSDMLESVLDSEFEPYRDEIFEILRDPITRLAQGISSYERHVHGAIQTLEEQRKAASLPRIQDGYGAEQARLEKRLDVLKRKAISKLLSVARTLYAINRQDEAIPLIRDARALCEGILRRGAEREDPLLSYYFAARIFRKFVGVKSQNDSNAPEIGKRKMAQILLLNSTRKMVLLQKRGAYKRSFAGTNTVSANAKVEGVQDILESSADAIRKETGLRIDPLRLEEIHFHEQPVIHLTIASFYAFSEGEENRLSAATLRHSESSAGATGVVVRYDSNARSLTVFSLNRKTSQREVRTVIEDIKKRTAVDYVCFFSNTCDGQLLVYQLNEREEGEIAATMKKRARDLGSVLGAIRSGLSGKELEILDSDEMNFFSLEQVQNESRTNLDKFMTDLTFPYFWRRETWETL